MGRKFTETRQRNKFIQSFGVSPIHNKLCMLTFYKMKELGFKDIKLFCNLPNSNKKIDLQGKKDGKLIGIECCTPSLIKSSSFCGYSLSKRIYSPLVDELIFSIPKRKMERKRKDSIENKEICWIFDINRV